MEMRQVTFYSEGVISRFSSSAVRNRLLGQVGWNAAQFGRLVQVLDTVISRYNRINGQTAGFSFEVIIDRTTAADGVPEICLDLTQNKMTIKLVPIRDRAPDAIILEVALRISDQLSLMCVDKIEKKQMLPGITKKTAMLNRAITISPGFLPYASIAYKEAQRCKILLALFTAEDFCPAVLCLSQFNQSIAMFGRQISMKKIDLHKVLQSIARLAVLAAVAKKQGSTAVVDAWRAAFQGELKADLTLISLGLTGESAPQIFDEAFNTLEAVSEMAYSEIQIIL